MNSTQVFNPNLDFPNGFLGLVFDVDGVLFDSRASNMLYYNCVRHELGLPDLNPEEESFCHMASVQESIEYIVPAAMLDNAYEACRKINYRERILPLLTLEPGVIDFLQLLKGHRVRCAIFTNRSSSVDELLRMFDLEEFFFPVKTAATGRAKPHPDGLVQILEEWDVGPDQIAFLGDSKVDEMAASSARVPFWAFRSPDLDARLHVADFPSLINTLSPLVEGR